MSCRRSCKKSYQRIIWGSEKGGASVSGYFWKGELLSGNAGPWDSPAADGESAAFAYASGDGNWFSCNEWCALHLRYRRGGPWHSALCADGKTIAGRGPYAIWGGSVLCEISGRDGKAVSLYSGSAGKYPENCRPVSGGNWIWSDETAEIWCAWTLYFLGIPE